MGYMKSRLEERAGHWGGISLNDQIAGREATPMITVEMSIIAWEALWAKDPTPALYEALKESWRCLVTILEKLTEPEEIKAVEEMIRRDSKALAKAEGK